MAQQRPPRGGGRDESRATTISIDSPNVDVGRDDEGRVRVLRHPREAYSAERAGLKEPSARGLADAYVREVLPIYDLTDEQAAELSAPVRRQPIDEGPRLRVDQEKTVLDTVVVSYQQTVLGLPIWQAALQVRMYGDPLRVGSSDSTLHEDVRVELPSAEELRRFADDASGLYEVLGLDSR